MIELLPLQESLDFSSSQLHLHPSPLQAPSDGSTTSIDLPRIYNDVIRTDSFKNMHRITSSINLVIPDEDQVMLAQVLCPDPDRVRNAVHRSKSNSLSNLVNSYFSYSEETTALCLSLRRSVAAARRVYSRIHTLLDDLPLHSLTQSQCDLIFQEFGKFNEEDNPFLSPNLQNFDGIRDLYNDLKRQLERRLRKSSSMIRFVRPPICCSGSDAIMAYIPPRFAKRELAYAAQLKVASRNTYVLKADLDTLYSQVERLHNAVEDDKGFIRTGLRLGNDINTVQEVLKQLVRNQQNLGHNLDLLDQKITTSFITINRSRSQLLDEILRHQTSFESSHSQ